jgi:hypothetical protein
MAPTPLAGWLPGMRGTAAICFRGAVPAAAVGRSGKSAGHFHLHEIQCDARAPRGDSGSTRWTLAFPASRGKRGKALGPADGAGTRDRAASRRGQVQPRDRPAALHLAPDGRCPPVPDFPEAGHCLSRPAAFGHLRMTRSCSSTRSSASPTASASTHSASSTSSAFAGWPGRAGRPPWNLPGLAVGGFPNSGLVFVPGHKAR